MRGIALVAAVVGLVLVMVVGGAAGKKGGAAEPEVVATPYVQAQSQVLAGQYFSRVAGCNGCHTEGWEQSGGKLPTSEWLTGTSLGHSGPWGTTYATNLRLTAKEDTEAEWVAMFRHPDPERAPMPWKNLKTANERDLKVIYQFLKSLGPKGKQAPDYLPVGKAPKTAYIQVTVHEAKGR